MFLSSDSGRRSAWVCWECGKATQALRVKEIEDISGKSREHNVCWKCSDSYARYQLVLAVTAMVIGFGGLGLLGWVITR